MTTDQRILLLGKNGQLGWELQRTLPALGFVTAIDYEDVDFLDPVALREAVRGLVPQIIVNAAAYTDVDGAEGESQRAEAINAAAPGLLAEEAKKLGAILIHYSTDYVFDGTKGAPYFEGDRPNPLNVYGVSKLAGEQAVQAVGGFHVILRTAWVYSRRGKGFVQKVLEWARQSQTMRIVNDQVSNPTWARTLAEATARMMVPGLNHVREHVGLYHLAGEGYASRFEWAKSVLELDPRRGQQVVQRLLPAATSEFPTPARRPLFSALDCQKFRQTFGLQLPPWRIALHTALAEDAEGPEGARSSS